MQSPTLSIPISLIEAVAKKHKMVLQKLLDEVTRDLAACWKLHPLGGAKIEHKIAKGALTFVTKGEVDFGHGDAEKLPRSVVPLEFKSLAEPHVLPIHYLDDMVTLGCKKIGQPLRDVLDAVIPRTNTFERFEPGSLGHHLFVRGESPLNQNVKLIAFASEVQTHADRHFVRSILLFEHRGERRIYEWLYPHFHGLTAWSPLQAPVAHDADVQISSLLAQWCARSKAPYFKVRRDEVHDEAVLFTHCLKSLKQPLRERLGKMVVNESVLLEVEQPNASQKIVGEMFLLKADETKAFASPLLTLVSIPIRFQVSYLSKGALIEQRSSICYLPIKRSELFAEPRFEEAFKTTLTRAKDIFLEELKKLDSYLKYYPYDLWPMRIMRGPIHALLYGDEEKFRKAASETVNKWAASVAIRTDLQDLPSLKESLLADVRPIQGFGLTLNGVEVVFVVYGELPLTEIWVRLDGEYRVIFTGLNADEMDEEFGFRMLDKRDNHLALAFCDLVRRVVKKRKLENTEVEISDDPAAPGRFVKLSEVIAELVPAPTRVHNLATPLADEEVGVPSGKEIAERDRLLKWMHSTLGY